MSSPVALGIGEMTRKLCDLLFNPLLCGTALYALTRSPEVYRKQLEDRLLSVISERGLDNLILGLKVGFVAGLVRKGNGILNSMALNHWKVCPDKKKWNWPNEIAVITGGCSGIGELVAIGLAQKQIKVAVLDIQGLSKPLEKYPNIKYYKCDVTKPYQIDQVAKSIRQDLGIPTILINNAGIGSPHLILDTTEEYLEKIFRINIMSHFTLVREFLPDMIKQNKGHIVEVASMASFVAIAGMVDYACTKAAVLAFYEGLNQELRHRHKCTDVILTVVHPNWAATPLLEAHISTKQHKLSSLLLRAEQVSRPIVNQILSCRGGQIVVPRALEIASGVRGWSNWLQESLRDGECNTTDV